jgi:uncharacterized protein RhaS with RHS repeats
MNALDGCEKTTKVLENGNTFSTHTYPDGSFFNQETDANGNVVYYSNSNNYWRKTEYNSENRVIVWNDSNGNYEQFDSDGRLEAAGYSEDMQ